MYVFYYKEVVLGGAELLIEKMGHEFVRQKETAELWCWTADADMVRRFQLVGINVRQGIEVGTIQKYRKDYSEGSINFICFQLVDYCYLNSSINKEDKLILYVMHFASLCMGKRGKIQFVKDIWKKIIPILLVRLMKANSLYVMDEATVDYTRAYYNNRLLNSIKFNIIRIPIDIVEVDTDAFQRTNKNSILTIARADFPFKGYLLGLIKYMKRIPTKYILDIVSYGKDEYMIHEVLAHESESVKKRVHLHGKMNLEDIEELYDNSIVYIGMGTTILDASQRGIISIPVKPDTYDLQANNIFIEDYRKIMDDSEDSNRFENLLDSILNMSPKYYRDNAVLGRKLVIDHYSTTNIVHDLKKEIENSRRINVKFVERIVRFVNILKDNKKRL